MSAPQKTVKPKTATLDQDVINKNVIHDDVAVSALWGGVRIVVIDTETTSSPEGGRHRVVDLAAVTCREGLVRGAWQTYVNPGVPIDEGTRKIHGITDDQVEGEPIFAALATNITQLLTEADGERLFVAGHNVAFDASVLRREYRLADLEVPDVPVIDTAEPLAALVGVQTEGRGLTKLLEALGIVNTRPHSALGDALATAEALVQLLNRAAVQGHTDLDELLALVTKSTTLRTASSGSPSSTEVVEAKALPATHLEGHATVLTKRAGARMLAKWKLAVAECAELRCRHLRDRVLAAEAPGATLITLMQEVMVDHIAAKDTAGLATIVGAMGPLYYEIPLNSQRKTLLSAVPAWAKRWGPRFEPLGRCQDGDLCPSCREGEACPLDVWPVEAAAAAMSTAPNKMTGFFRTRGGALGGGTWSEWRRKLVDPRLCDEALLLCIERARADGDGFRANLIVEGAYDAACRHPDVVEAYAALLAAPGQEADFARALKVCDEAIEYRHGSSHEGWRRLATRRSLIEGRQRKLHVRYSDKLDEDGNPIPIRIHAAKDPKRTRQPRFLRQ